MILADIRDSISKIHHSLGGSVCSENDLKDQILSLQRLSNEVVSNPPREEDHNEIRHLGEKLWNSCVYHSQHSELSIEKRLYFTSSLREISIDLFGFNWSKNDENGYSVKSEVTKMYIRTGRDWSKIENYDKSLHVYNRGLKNVSILEEMSKECGSKKDVFKYIRVVFNLYCSVSECYRMKKSFEESFKFAENAKKMIENNEHVLITEIEKLAMIQYNAGVDLYQMENYKLSIKLLCSSFEVYKFDKQFDNKKQARTLRLLSMCCLKVKDYQHAINSIIEASNYYKDIDNLFLKVKTYVLMQKKEETLKSILEMINSHNIDDKNDLIKVLEILNYAGKRKMVDEADEGFNYLIKKCEKSKKEIVKVKIFEKYVEMLISPQISNVLKAKEIMIKIIQDFHSQVMMISKEQLKNFHILMWNLGTSKFQAKELSQSLQWFQFSLDLIPVDDRQNRGKVLRQITKCYVELQDYDMALKSINQSIKICGVSIYSFFLLFEIYCAKNDVENAKKVLQEMKKLNNFHLDFYAYASQLAHEKKSSIISAKALEEILFDKSFNEQSQLSLIEKGIILRSLARIYTGLRNKSNDIPKNLLKVLQLALNLIKKSGVSEIFEKDHDKELRWFHNVAWNEGIDRFKQCDFNYCYQFFNCASEFLSYIKDSFEMKENVEIQIFCLYVRIFSLLEIYKTVKKNEFLEKAIKEIENCKKYMRKKVDLEINEKKDLEDKKVDDDQDIMMKDKEIDTNTAVTFPQKMTEKRIPIIVLEFKAKLLLRAHDQELIEILSNGMNKKELTYDDLETISEISLKHASQLLVCQKALHYCIEKLPNIKENVYEALTLFRKLIECCQQKEEEEEVIRKFHDYMSSLDSEKILDPKNSQSILYFVIKTWNNAVYYYKINRTSAAERWGGLAVKLCQFAKNVEQGENLRNSISDKYVEILQKKSEKKEQEQIEFEDDDEEDNNDKMEIV